MKKRTSKFLAVILALVCVLSLAGCSSQKVEETAIDESTQEYMEGSVDSLLGALDQLSAEDLENYKQADDNFTIAAVMAYEAVKDELGAYQGIESTLVELEEKEYTVTAVANYAVRKATIVMTLDSSSQGVTPTSITIDGHYTLAENLKKAGLNTLMGVGVVFVVLIFLTFLISLFGLIGKLEKKEEPKKAAVAAPAAPAAAAEEDVTDDLELIAVIAAAIAAAEGTSTDGFVVRSVRKVNKSKWRSA